MDTKERISQNPKENNNNIKKVFPVILLLFLITIVLGITYAVATYTKEGGINTITTGNISMSFIESTNVITLNNALPTSDAVGKVSSEYFDFSVTTNTDLNEGHPNIDTSYEITIEPLSVTNGYTALTGSQIKVYLENSSASSVLVDSKLISSLNVSESNTTNKVLYTNSHTHSSEVDSITTNYRLRAWIDYNVDSSNWTSSNKYEYKFRININGVAEYEQLNYLYNLVASQSLGTDTENNIDYSAISSDTNGKGVYTINDTASDEYPVYFYRGEVTNNNVVFGKYCWKIVRTTSTGGVKLIYNGEYSESNKCNNTGTASQLADASAFNSSSSAAYYVGYYYDTSNTMTTMNNGTALNTTPSLIATAINTWYASEESGMTDLTYMLENEKWCNDRTNDGSKYFGAYTRVSSSPSSVNPSIECPNNNDAFTLKKDKGGVEGYGNNILDYPVGLLTADEVIYAGGNRTTSNSSYYLYTSINYWTLSPYYFDGDDASGFRVVLSGVLNYDILSFSRGVRPSVSLMRGVIVTEGAEGTASDPHIIVLD